MTTITAINTGSIIPVTRGGTGAAELTADRVVVGNGTSAIGTLDALGDGQLIIGRNGQSPVVSTLTAGDNVTITEGEGSITIAASAAGAGVSYEVVATATQMEANKGYVTNGDSQLLVTLPTDANSDLGDWIAVTTGTQSFRIAQNADDQIRIGSETSTTGASGWVESTAPGDGVFLVKVAANRWQAAFGTQGVLNTDAA